MEIPRELTECEMISNLSFEECSRLFAVPTNLLAMPKLVNVSFKRCNLFAVPSMISPKIMNLSLGGNQLLNCVPSEAVKFIDPSISTAEFYMIEDGDLTDMIEAQ